MDAPCGVEKDTPAQDGAVFAVTQNEKLEISPSQKQVKKETAETGAMDPSSEISSSSAKSNAREIAVQANDYDIERNSSHLPSRKRYIPLKFSDYRIFAGDDDQAGAEEEDVSFEPEKSAAKPKVPKTPSGRGRGRPRKNPEHLKSTTQDSPSQGSAVESLTSKSQIVKVPSGFKCSICSHVFSLRGNAKAHLITHTDEKPFPCEFEGCGKRLRTKESLRRHQLSHMGIKMFECSECNKKFSCNASLQEHMARHTGAKPLSCDVCGRKFRQIAVLKRHLTTHSSEKPFACSVCGKRFAMKIYVQSHMKTHTGERPFSCDICNKTFAHASDLNRHKIIHSGKKPYECSVCSMRYSDPSSRRRHEREHQTKLVCPVCNQQFSRSSHLRIHLVQEHGTEQEALSYQVQVVAKSDQESWPDGAKEGKLLRVVQNLGTPNLIVEHTDGAEVCGQEIKVEQESNGGTSAVQLLLESPGLTQSLGEKSAEIAVCAEDDLSQLQPGCIYKIVGNDSENQIFELQLEEGAAGFPLHELAGKVEFANMQLGEETVTLIQQDDAVTVVQTHQEHTTAPTVVSAKELPSLVSSTAQHYETHGETNTTVEQAETEHEQTLEVVPIEADQTINDEVEMRESTEEPPPANEDIVLREEQSFPQKVSDEPEFSVLSLQAAASLSDSTYVYQPDLNSQEYYNWLSAFAEECKVLTMPLDKSKFEKISHIHKTLVDFMALPSGVTSDKNNFKVLLTIMKELSDVLNKHLSFMYQNLS